MARTKMAPDLAAVMTELAEFWEGDGPADRARAQYRALLLVARAARKIADLTEHAHRNGNQTCAAEWTVVRAVRSLDRVSGRQRKGGRP